MKQGKFSLSAVEAITGVGRSTLGRYARDGVLEGIRKSRLQSANWDIDLFEIVSEMQTLRITGWSSEDAERLLREGPAGLRRRAHASCYDRYRQARRLLRCADAFERRFEALNRVTDPERVHLRYIPERWFALLPLPHIAKALPYGNGFAEAATLLDAIAACAGWCAHPSFSTMTCFDAEFGAPRSFVMQELASLPMPDPTLTEMDDCGCYQVFRKNADAAPCAEGACWQCCRFGRAPSSLERRSWAVYEKRHPEVDGALRSDEGDGNAEGAAGMDAFPPTCGPWAERSDIIARTPQLMPMTEQLPCGAGACLMPGGFYLTMQGDEERLESIREHLLGLLMMLDSICLSPSEAADIDAGPGTASGDGIDGANEALSDDARVAAAAAAAPSGFKASTGSLSRHDEPMHGWATPIDTTDLDRVRLVENAGMCSDSDLCLIVDSLPVLESGAPPRFEVQALVDASDLLQDDPVSRGRFS